MAFAGDVGAWFTNVASSVMIIFVNKLLMGQAGYAYNFAVTLSAFHYLTSATMMQGYKWSGFMTVTKSMSTRDLVLYCAVSNLSIISLNVSLMVNQARLRTSRARDSTHLTPPTRSPIPCPPRSASTRSRSSWSSPSCASWRRSRTSACSADP